MGLLGTWGLSVHSGILLQLSRNSFISVASTIQAKNPYYSFRLYARAALAWTEEERSLRNEKLKANRAS